MPTIMILEGSASLRTQILKLVVTEGFDVSACENCNAARELLSRRPMGLLIAGSVLADTFASLEAIAELKHITDLPTIFIPPQSSEAIAIAALRVPVQEYLPLPFDESDLLAAIRRLMMHSGKVSGIVGSADAMVRIRTLLRKIALSNCNTLITGETGTGKELVAEEIHSLGGRRTKPFIAVNCAAIPEALLESELFGYERGAFTGAGRRADGLLHAAEGGTLFLDEIGEMSLSAQSKILRAIETGQVRRVGSCVTTSTNIRLIAATNRNLETMIDDGHFRPDLYYRINVARIDLPPLRERPEDILTLARHFLGQSSGKPVMISEEAGSLLVRYGWPGNIRELKNVIEATLIYLTDNIIRPRDFPEFFLRRVNSMRESPSERNRLIAVLEQTHWNKSRAAESLQWSRMTLYRKIAKYGVKAEFRNAREHRVRLQTNRTA